MVSLIINPNLARTALHEAISMSHLQVFQYLIYKAADKSITNDAMETPFNIAERKGFKRDTLNLFFGNIC